MTVCLSVEVPAAPARRFDVLTVLEELQARIRSAEERADGLQHALASNRRIGMAVGILMCQRRLTEDQAIALLRTRSQSCNVKVRELAETAIYTGTL
jgi:AmiR/NasT family two-component response regulator